MKVRREIISSHSSSAAQIPVLTIRREKDASVRISRNGVRCRRGNRYSLGPQQTLPQLLCWGSALDKRRTDADKVPQTRYSRLLPLVFGPRRQNLFTKFSADLCDHIQQFRQRRHTPLRLQTLYFRLKLRWAEFECPDRENLRLHFFLPNFPTGLLKSSRSAAATLFRSSTLNFRMAFISSTPISSSVFQFVWSSPQRHVMYPQAVQPRSFAIS
jgi:hypothetical protein